MANILLTLIKLLFKLSVVISSTYSTCQGCYVKHGPLLSVHHWVELRNNVYKQLTEKNPIKCGLICAKDSRCLSFNYYKDSTKCVFNDANKVDGNDVQLVYNPLSVYYLRFFEVRKFSVIYSRVRVLGNMIGMS